MPNNEVRLVGNVGKDAEVRYTSGGKAIASFTLATSEKKDGPTTWHNVEAWEKTAEVAAKYCKKGTPVAIEGAIKYQTWEDKENKTHYKTVISAYRIRPLVRVVLEASDQQMNGEPAGQPSQPDEQEQVVVDEENLPF